MHIGCNHASDIIVEIQPISQKNCHMMYSLHFWKNMQQVNPCLQRHSTVLIIPFESWQIWVKSFTFLTDRALSYFVWILLYLPFVVRFENILPLIVFQWVQTISLTEVNFKPTSYYVSYLPLNIFHNVLTPLI